MNIETITKIQRDFFQTGITLTYAYRKSMLEKLYNGIIKYQDRIIEALQKDLGKSDIESILTEIWMVLAEIRFHQKHLKRWMKKKRVRTSLVLKPGKSYLIDSPLGINLIISPWNYPFHLAILPLVGAISAGNTVVLKPSSQSFHTSKVIKKLCDELFSYNYITCFLGDHKLTDSLLEQDFDHIFFTGSPQIGSMIMAKASKNLTKVTLELGGKSPAIIHHETRLNSIIPRIVFGKWLNAGQTCVAPDYLICPEKLYEESIKLLKHYINEFFPNSLENLQYPHIISRRHFNRLINLLNNEEIIFGGFYNEESLKIAPTIIKIKDLNSPLMKEEIFGPILPIITYQNEDEITNIINLNPNPLAFYVFSENKLFNNRMLYQHQFGGACVNDTISHLISHHLPFGGVKTSGQGQYHGYESFKCFSHQKSVYIKHPRLELKLKYPPYSKWTIKIIKKYFTK